MIYIQLTVYKDAYTELIRPCQVIEFLGKTGLIKEVSIIYDHRHTIEGHPIAADVTFKL